LFSGFWSKDEILHHASHWPVSHIPFYLGAAGALLTAFYMTRQVALVLFGKYRGSGEEAGHHSHSPHSSHTPHESPRVMTVPLIILAVCAVLLGVIGTPAWPWFEGYMKGEATAFDMSRFGDTWVLMVSSSAIVLAGITIGVFLYGKRQRKTVEEKDVLEAAQPFVFRVLENKYFIDELYEMTVIRFNAFAAWLADFLDTWIFGGAVLLVSYVAVGCSWLYRLTDENVVNRGFDAGCESLRESGGLSSKLHSGRVQTYLRVIGVALVVLVLILIWGRKA
jgi:NADH-quinone oxidoreductase subunit L